jgi:hypothetical protein
MNDQHFIAAMQLGIPPLPKPDDLMDQAIKKMIATLPAPGTLNTIYRVRVEGGDVIAECVPESEWRLPEVPKPVGLEVTDCSGVIKGNADLELSDLERIEGIVAMDKEIGYE